jgi:hypothetical protein
MGGKHGCIAKMQNTICHGEYIKRQINILTMERSYRFCDIGLMLYNLSEHQIEALSNLLRGINDCFISQPKGSGKSAVYQFIFPFAFI